MSESSGAWSPCLVSALVGLLSMLTFYLSDKPLGVSSAYARIAGLITKRLAPSRIGKLKLYQDVEPKVARRADGCRRSVRGMRRWPFIAGFVPLLVVVVAGIERYAP